MNLTATHFYTYFRPSRCELRIFLNAHGVQAAAPGPYEEVLRKLGERHEKTHLATFSRVIDLSQIRIDERTQKTFEEVQRSAPVIYQALLKAEAGFGGIACEIVGEPDFLIKEGDGYVIRDCKLSRRINEKDHPEILRQLQIYSWLFQKTFDARPLRLEVLCGTGSIELIEDDGGATALQELEEIVRYASSDSEPFSPVGWSKCDGCGFRDRCWSRAEAAHDVALLPKVDQGLARVLHELGTSSYEKLLVDFDEKRLGELRRPWGKSLRKVGKDAGSIMLTAQAMASGKEIVVAKPDIPQSSNYVMFDLEGLPPHLDELEKIYFWGMQVFGDCPSQHIAAITTFGEDGDRATWEDFLGKSGAILSDFGDIPFAHWHHYERVKLDMYVQRFGDKDGIAERVKGNLLDLLPITRDSITLPLPSYTLKLVEKHVGYERKLAGYAGDKAMARFIEATETEDETLRQEVMAEICAYNREDLEATWAVLCWLRSKRV